MSREKRLVKNTIIYAIGNFSSKFLGILLLPFYTYYLSVEDYGYFELVTTTVSLILPIITFQLADGLYRYIVDEKKNQMIQSVVSNVMIIIVKNLILFNLLYLIITYFYSFDYKYLILVQINIQVIYSVWLQISRGLKNNAVFSVAGVITTIITLLMNVILIVNFGMKVNALIISNIVAALITIIYVEYKIKILSFIKYKHKNKNIKEKLILYSIPLIPNVVNWWFMNVSDRYLLKYYIGMQANGIYAVANKFPSILVMINSIFYLAWQESAITEYKSKDRDKFYTKMFNALVIIQFTSMNCILSVTILLLKYTVNDKFYIAYQYIPFLYAGAVFSSFSSFYGVGYQCSKDTKGAFYTSVFGSMLNVIINIIFIPKIGIQAASLSTMLSFLIMWIFRIYQTKKYINIKINKRTLFLNSTISTIFICLYYLNSYIIQCVLIIISIVIFITFNRNIIKSIRKIIKNKLGNR